MDSVEDLRVKIAGHAARLDSLNGADGKRIRKRVLATLGKLKKDLADAEIREASGANKRARVEEAGDMGSEPTLADVVVPKKQLKAKLHLLNKELADFAQKKQLKNAVKSFTKAQKRGIPVDVHSFANLINVYVRCGDIDSAQRQVGEMNKLNILPNGVLLTTLIKGYCENGDITAAKEILDGMCGLLTGATMFPHIVYTESSRPNIRTVNTFFRGCIRVGDVNSALSYFERFRHSDSNQLGVSPDKTTYEYVLLLLCQALRYDEAKDVLSKYSVCADSAGSGGVHSSDVSDSTGVYISMTRCALLVCEFAEAAKWLEIARTCLQFAQNAPLREAMLKQKDSHKADSAGRESGRNVSMFLQHQQNEMENELELFAQFLQSVRSQPDGQVELAFTEFLISSMSKLLYFDYDSLAAPTGSAESDQTRTRTKAVNKQLVETLVEKFGLQRLLSVHSLLKAREGAEGTASAGSLGAQALKRVMSSVSRSDSIQFEQVFADFGQEAGPGGSSIHLEIGAGYGEWVIEQAWCAAPRSWEARSGSSKADKPDTGASDAVDTEAGKAEAKQARKHRRRAAPVEKKSNIHVYDQELHAEMIREEESRSEGAADTAAKAQRGGGHWVSLELRCDRVYSTFTRNAMKRFMHSMSSTHSAAAGGTGTAEPAGEMRSNLLILGGDANSILNAHFPRGRVGSIHINHPEPPERTGHFKDGGASGSKGGVVNCNDSSYWASGRHLLTKGFFGSMCDVLEERGTITIVTDNKHYAVQLGREIWLHNDQAGAPGGRSSKLRCPFFKCSNFALSSSTLSSMRTSHGEEEESFEESTGAGPVAAGGGDGSGRTLYRLIDSTGNVLDPQGVNSSSNCFSNMQANVYIYQGEAPAIDGCTGDAGGGGGGEAVATAASSYFDRMWNLGEMKRRWFVHVKKSV
jgi:pentatricopeptide repeat protein